MDHFADSVKPGGQREENRGDVHTWRVDLPLLSWLEQITEGIEQKWPSGERVGLWRLLLTSNAEAPNVRAIYFSEVTSPHSLAL
jgi:hypothetical protein